MDADKCDLSNLLKRLKESNEEETKIKNKISRQKEEIVKTEKMMQQFQDCLTEQNELLSRLCNNQENAINTTNQIIQAIKQLDNENEEVSTYEDLKNSINSVHSETLIVKNEDKMNLSIIINETDFPVNEIQILPKNELEIIEPKKRKLNESINGESENSLFVKDKKVESGTFGVCEHHDSKIAELNAEKLKYIQRAKTLEYQCWALESTWFKPEQMRKAQESIQAQRAHIERDEIQIRNLKIQLKGMHIELMKAKNDHHITSSALMSLPYASTELFPPVTYPVIPIYSESLPEEKRKSKHRLSRNRRRRIKRRQEALMMQQQIKSLESALPKP